VIRLRALAVLALAATIVWAAPLAGLAIAGRPIAAFAGFPPRTAQIAQMPFAWGAFIALALTAIGALAVFGAAIAAAGKARPPNPVRAAGYFPWWGWLGIALIAVVWPVAWTEGLAPPAWRAHTFSLLWLGYILAMNGLQWRRSGVSLLTHRTRWFLALFVLSAGFWWLFEYLDQFVRNWYYDGVEAMGDGEYFLRATLPFATVLPAVASTWAWLRQFPRLEAMALPAVHGNGALAWSALAAGVLALVAIGLVPSALFPMLWIAPVLVLAGLQQLAVGETVFSPIARDDWRPILQPALAALVCGFFWEMWNYGSLPKWHYSIPYVQRFHLFEMPALGYAGYLPFGIECALVMDLTARIVERRALWPLEGEANPQER
jgi:hypothetical protein